MRPTTTQENEQLLADLETELGVLAARWRGADTSQEAEVVVQQYQALLRRMLALGYHHWLDVESELPDRYMSTEYLSGDFLKRKANAPSPESITDHAALFGSEKPSRRQEQLPAAQSGVASNSRTIGSRNNAINSGVRTYGARSARDRRAASMSRSRNLHRERAIRPEIISSMLEHPTITVTEEQLRREYSYVLSDLRNMAVTAAALIVAMFVLAEILPK